MRALILSAIKNRKITLFFVLATVFYGLVSYYFLPKQENPDLHPTIAMVTAVYPGASPEDMEKLVTEKIEDAAGEISSFDHVRSYSKDSLSIVIVYIKASADREKSWRELREKIDDLYPKLPKGTWKPEINSRLGETSGLLIALSGEGYNYDQLEDFAEQFKEKLRKIDGVVRFDIAGKIDREVKIEVDIAKLNQYALSLEDIWLLLQAQNIEIPSGAISDGQTKINVSVPGKFESLRDIENTVIGVSTADGSLIKLRDIAAVRMALKEEASRIRHNGKDAVILAGFFEESKNVLIIGDDVRKTIDAVKQTLPKSLIVDEVLYQPDDVEMAINDFMMNLLEGMLLVIIVVFVGMGFRNAVVVAVAIPLSMLMTYICMGFLDIKVHQISTVALIIALGMLVDNAIVVSDAIQIKIDEGMDRVKASFEGTVEVAVPIFTSTLTTVAGYFPLALLPGQIGQYVLSIPQLVIISLSASYVVAMLVTPTIAAFMFRKANNEAERRAPVKKIFTFLITRGLDRPKLAMALVGVVLIGALALGTLLPVRFFPNADKNLVSIDITSEIAELNETDKVARQVEALLKDYPEIIKITTAVGDDLPKFYITMMPKAPSKEYGQILLRLDLDKTGRFRNNEDFGFNLQQRLDTVLTGGVAKVKILQQAEPMDAPVMLRLTAEKYEDLQKISKKLQDELRQIQGTMNVRDNAPRERLEFLVTVHDEIASSFGITKYDVQRQINLALRGDKASVFRKAGTEFDIVVQGAVTSLEQLENLAIKSSIAGNKILLKQIAEINLKPRREFIYRYDKELSISVLADVMPSYGAPEIMVKVLQSAVPKVDAEQVTIRHDGELKNIIDNFSNLGIACFFALLFNYLILLVEFKSLLQPLVILLTVPLSVIGALLGLFIFRQPFSFTAFLGITSLVGVVVNNAIILMEYINTERDAGHDLKKACYEAYLRRYRPIMLSNVTTVVGLVPLAISGSTLFEPMSVAQMCGMMIATLLTLIVIPVVYYLSARTEK